MWCFIDLPHAPQQLVQGRWSTRALSMKTGSLKAPTIERIACTITAVACISIWGLVTAAPTAPSGGSVPLTVPKATCGPNDHPETGLQGQVPAAMRATGFKGFNCNLELIGQSKGDGANWQTTQFRDVERVRHRGWWGFPHWHKREVVCGY